MKFAISMLAILIIKSLLATPSKEKKIVVLKIFVFSFWGGGRKSINRFCLILLISKLYTVSLLRINYLKPTVTLFKTSMKINLNKWFYVICQSI